MKVHLLVLIAVLAAVPAHAQVPLAAEATPSANTEPFAFADFTWVPGNGRTTKSLLTSEYFTGEFRLDTAYHYSLAAPQDDTIVGSTEVFRHGEVHITHLGLGGDFHAGPAHGRVMAQLGLYSQTTPASDATVARGQWRMGDAYRYLSEAYGGYHFDALNGVNVQAGVFMSFIGLWSYYNADNWTYQPSYVSSNTPWYFNGARIQAFWTDRLKTELWLVNGWQSYGRYADAPGVGGQVLWRPSGNVSVVSNLYYGADTLGTPDRKRVHSDSAIMWKYRDAAGSWLSKAAASLTVDLGCESGGGVACADQSFLGFMAYNRLWLARDQFGVTVGGGAIRNPGRYLVLLPPINGATATTGTPYFSTAPGTGFVGWDTQLTADWMPTENAMFRAEFNHRAANVPYFAGSGGVTPPGGNTGKPSEVVPGWQPDLRKTEDRFTLALLIKI